MVVSDDGQLVSNLFRCVDRAGDSTTHHPGAPECLVRCTATPRDLWFDNNHRKHTRSAYENREQTLDPCYPNGTKLDKLTTLAPYERKWAARISSGRGYFHSPKGLGITRQLRIREIGSYRKSLV